MASSLNSVLGKLEIVSTSDHASVVSMSLFVALLCACIVIGHLLEESRWMNESIVALLIGLCTGFVILLSSRWKSSRILVFSEDLFFIYLLPPIIFNAGFQVKKKQFFRNFITIVMFGAVGTLISWAVISLGVKQIFGKMDIGFQDVGDYFAIGAIFSATDSVCTLQVLNQDETPLLYSLVFGEGVVNDATSVVLFNAIESFDVTNVNPTIALHFMGNFFHLFFTSTMLGVLTGLLSAYIIKKLYIGRHSTDREVALMMLMAYLSYMIAELFYLSGILTVFFCGIVMSHYTWHNVTESSRITTKHAFATLSFVAEIFIFLYVGMDALDIEKWKLMSDRPGTSVAVSSILLGLILVGRAAFVFPLSFLSNLSKKTQNEKIGFKQQVTIWWAGLMRGAVSMALAYNKFTSSGHTHLQGHAVMITSTITVVLFSTVVFGLLTKPLVRLLLPKQSGSTLSSEPGTPKSPFTMPLLEGGEDRHTNEDVGGDKIPRPSSLRLLLTTPTHTVHRLWRKFDDTFMRPVFGGRGFVPQVPSSPPEQQFVN
ncbi:sodium/hydrogen exchanger 2-like [Rhododendron vialii]|uniref:sodium/hydrogen exchanger 2-like n=1 Tax=Rhododendron vialii TaxID=182163 RepID=UPI00265DB5D1|nr:sodium/hydrogen exchanger 2-like [Rhododendron vialii]